MTTPRVPRIFSEPRRANRAARANTYAAGDDASRWLAQEIERDVIERLDFMQLAPPTALITGPDSGEFAGYLRAKGCGVASLASVDEEQPLPDAPYDLIVSLLRLDTVNDLPGALLHARAALAENGLFIACMTGAGSLSTLRHIMMVADGERPAARIHPQIDNRAASALMQRAGFSRQVVDSHTLTVTYASLDRLFADLREQGLTNALADAPPPLTRGALARAYAAFEELRAADGRVSECFELLTLTGWR